MQKNRYHNMSEEKKKLKEYQKKYREAKVYYKNDKERLRKKVRDKHINLSEKYKNDTSEKDKNNMSEEKKQKLKEY